MAVRINDDTLEILRKGQDRSKIYMSVNIPDTLWEANINDSSIEFGETQITFDSGSGSDFSAVKPLQEVWVGTSPGNDDVGRLRIRTIGSGDGGVTGTMKVSANSLPYADNLYLTFKHDYPLKPKYSLLYAPDPENNPDEYYVWKDEDIPYSDQNEEPNPVVIAGSHKGGFIRTNFTINPGLNRSYAMASGATIVSYSASAYPSTGVSIGINGSTGVGTISFTVAGKYWVKYTVTDSNGKSQSSYRFYYAHATLPSSEHFPFVEFVLDGIIGKFDSGGYKTTITTNENKTITDIPKGALCVLWEESEYLDAYGNVIGSVTSNATTGLAPLSPVLFCGYVTEEKISKEGDTGTGEISLTLNTIDELMRNRLAFSINLDARSSVDEWTEYDVDEFDLGHAVHHVWLWHSTLMEICDVWNLRDHTDRRAFTPFDKNNLYDMANDLLSNAGDRSRVVCHKDGSIYLPWDRQLLTDSERQGLQIAAEIDAEDKTGRIDITIKDENRVGRVTTQGFAFDGTFYSPCDDDECCKSPPCDCTTTPCPDVEAFCAQAPGDWPSDYGGSTADFPRQVFRSQQHANKIAGRFFAKENNPYPEFRMTFHSNYFRYIDVAYNEAWTVTLTASDTTRQIIWVEKKLFLQSVEAKYDHETGHMYVNAVFEPEADGFDGVPYTCPSMPSLDWDFDFDFEFDFGEGLWSGNSVRLLPIGNTSWSTLTEDSVNDIMVDRSQLSISTSTTVLWRCGQGEIMRSENGGEDWTNVTPSYVGVDPDIFPGDLVNFMMLDSDIFSGDRVVCLASYTVGSEFAQGWLVISYDNGISWESVPIHSQADLSLGNAGDIELFRTSQVGNDAYWSNTAIVPMGLDKFAVVLGGEHEDDSDDTLEVFVCTMSDGGIISVGSPSVLFKEGDSLQSWVAIPLGPSNFFIVYDYYNVAADETTHQPVSGPYGVSVYLAGNHALFGQDKLLYRADDEEYGGELPGEYFGFPSTTTYSRINNKEIFVSFIDFDVDPPETQSYQYIKVTLIQCGGSLWGVSHGLGSQILAEYDLNNDDFFPEKLPVACVLSPMKYVVAWYDTNSTSPPIDVKWKIAGVRGEMSGNIFPLLGTPIDFATVTETSSRFSIELMSVSKVNQDMAICHWGSSSAGYNISTVKVLDTMTCSTRDTEPLRIDYSGSSYYYSYTKQPMYVTDNILVYIWSENSYSPLESVLYGHVINVDTDGTITVGPQTEILDYENDFGFGQPANGLNVAKVGGYFIILNEEDWGLPAETIEGATYTSYVSTIPVKYDLTGAGDLQPIAMMVDRFTNNYVFVTGYNGSELVVAVVDITLGEVTSSFSLGAATLAQVNSKTWIAYPQAAGYGSFLVYGRMNNPQDLGGTVHIARFDYDDWSIVENGWGLDYGGSMEYTSDGLHVVRNSPGGSARLYSVSSSSTTSKLILPFSETEFHGFTSSLYDNIYIASSNPQTELIIALSPPFDEYVDITYNHSTTSGVKALTAT